MDHVLQLGLVANTQRVFPTRMKKPRFQILNLTNIRSRLYQWRYEVATRVFMVYQEKREKIANNALQQGIG
jgi:hypothetical protein